MPKKERFHCFVWQRFFCLRKNSNVIKTYWCLISFLTQFLGNFTTCERERQSILGLPGFSVPPSAFVPVCKADGQFREIQCSTSTGYCWCVDRNGNPLFGTQVREEPVCQVTGRLDCFPILFQINNIK